MDSYATELEARTAGELKKTFRERFGVSPGDVQVVRSPFRICPLGAHVDHQLGQVSGMALDRSVLLAFVPRTEPQTRLASLDFPGEAVFDHRNIPPAQAGSWGNYLRGAALALKEKYPIKRGILGLVKGTLPIGGLGSSAAVGVSYLIALERANGLDLDAEENISLDQYIENTYLGLQNGILDQSVILLSRKDRLLELDCGTRSYHLVKLGCHPSSFQILIVHSGVQRTLISTDYNKHVGQCREAAALLLSAAGRPVPRAPVLGQVPSDVFEAHGEQLPPDLLLRARHFFGETARVRQGVEAWARGDLACFGKLMNESGHSSIHNYRCGSPELRTLYEILSSLNGVLGARFSGGGFGGCCIALIRPGANEEVSETVTERYLPAHPERKDGFGIFSCRSAPGACIP